MVSAKIQEKTMYRIASLIALALLISSPALAGFKGPGKDGGGFQGPQTGAAATTVEAARNLSDDSIVSLTGNIISHIAGTKDKYLFKDATGEIQIEIKDKYFRGQDVTPENTVRISGEIDKDFGKTMEIDVKHLEIVK